MTARDVQETPGVGLRRCHSFKASPIRAEQPIADLALIFDREPPNPPQGEGWRLEYQSAYENDANRVEEALFEHLPGGLYDQILRAMLTRKASLLKVSHQG